MQRLIKPLALMMLLASFTAAPAVAGPYHHHKCWDGHHRHWHYC